MKFSKWHIAPAEEADIRRLGEAGYPQLVSQVLAARGISTAEEAAAFLERGRDLTCSPFLMKDMDRAVECISRAIRQGRRMAVFGDYDVDGITATVILVDYLKSRGVDVLHYIPRRIEDGYGLGQDAIRSLHEQGVELLITVDCGITGNEEVDFAASIGLDVVITDHHECKEELPRALAVVDTHRSECPYPFKHLAGVGVALKLVLALGGESREEALFSRYCTLAAIGTIADVMRMEGENRTIVQCGLEGIDRSDFTGLHALLREAGLTGRPVSSVQIGFVLAPRINAAGRMGAADKAADLLLCQDPAEAARLARELCALNRERQAVEQTGLSDACVVGPGLGRAPLLWQIAEGLLETGKSVLLDADGLNALAGHIDILQRGQGEVVLPPHPGEMSRLCGLTVPEIESAREQVAAEFARRWGVTLLLKGKDTVIASPRGETHINPTGNSGMATGGMGDVLSGVIGSFLGQGLRGYEAAVLGAFLHGLAGDLAAKRLGGMIAGDVVKQLPPAVRKLQNP